MSSFLGTRGILVSPFTSLGHHHYTWVGYFSVVIDVFLMSTNYTYCIYLLCPWWSMIGNSILPVFSISDDHCDLDQGQSVCVC